MVLSMHMMSILCSTADDVSSGKWFTVFKVLTVNVAMLTTQFGHMVWISHGNLSVAVFFCIFLSNRCHLYKWIAVVSWLNCLILALDLWGGSAQHLWKLAIDLKLDSSVLLHIHYAAFHGFHWHTLIYIFVFRGSECIGFLVFFLGFAGSYSRLYYLSF